MGAMRFSPPPPGGPQGSQGAFPRNSQLGSFYPQLPTRDPGQTILLSCSCGPKVLATSVPNRGEVSGQEFLISHLLQYRLGLEKDFFRSLLWFILFLMMLDPNPFSSGEFCAHWMRKAETSDESRSLFYSLSCFHTCSLLFPSAPRIILNPLYTPAPPGSCSFTPLARGVRGDLAMASDWEAAGSMHFRCRGGVPTLYLLG